MTLDTPTIYIAGPMRGIDAYNFPAFDRCSDRLSSQGWIVINPADIDRAEGSIDTDPHQFNPSDNNDDHLFMRKAVARDIAVICERCTAIYMLSGWQHSDGAQAEHAAALAIGIEIHYENPK